MNCILCGKGFRNEAAIRSHNKRVHKNKPEECTYCGSAYTTIAHKAEHEMVCPANPTAQAAIAAAAAAVAVAANGAADPGPAN